MRSRKLDLAINLLLFMVLLTTGITGLLADYLGVPRSLFHRYSAYLLVLLAACHIVLNWNRFIAAWKSATRPQVLVKPAVQANINSSSSSLRKTQAVTRRIFLFSGAAGIAGFLLGRWLSTVKLSSGLDEEDLGLAYHKWSKPGLVGILRKPFQWGTQPGLYKEYPGARRIPLSPMINFGSLPIRETINGRRSIRDYSGIPLSQDQLSFMLHSAYGITEPVNELRSIPSAGALYPLEVYPVINQINGLTSGVYHYRPKDNSLDLIKEGDYRNALLASTFGQEMVLQANVAFVITAIFQRTRWKYQDRTYRYILLEAGHLGQNLYLAATSLGLGACAIGAFYDDELNRLVEADGDNEAAVYILSIGSRA